MADAKISQLSSATTPLNGAEIIPIVQGGVTVKVTTGDLQVGAAQVASISGNVTLDFSTYTNFVLTMTGNVTFDNPTTEVIGQAGYMVFIQDASGSRTLSLGTEYQTTGAAGLALSTAPNSRDVVPYIVTGSGEVVLGVPTLGVA